MPQPEKPLNSLHKMALSMGGNLASEYLLDFIRCVTDQRPIPPAILKYLAESFAAISRKQCKLQGPNRSNQMNQLVVKELGIGRSRGPKADRYLHPEALDVAWLRIHQGLTKDAALDKVLSARPGRGPDVLNDAASQRHVRDAAAIWPRIPLEESPRKPGRRNRKISSYRRVGPVIDVILLLMEIRGLTKEESIAWVASFWTLTRKELRDRLRNRTQVSRAHALAKHLRRTAPSFCYHRIAVVLGNLGRWTRRTRKEAELTASAAGWEHLQVFVRGVEEARPIPPETLIYLSRSFRAILQRQHLPSRILGQEARKALGLSGRP